MIGIIADIVFLLSLYKDFILILELNGISVDVQAFQYLNTR